MLLNGFPKDNFRETVAIDIRGVKRIDAEIVRQLNLFDALFLV